MRRQTIVLGLSLALVGLGVGCQQPAKPSTGGTPKVSTPGDPTPLAKIDDVVISVGDFENRINRQSPYIRARYASVERKKEFLDNLVRFETLAKEATRRGYAKDEEVLRTMKQVMIQKLMKDEFDQKIKLENITDEECRKYYDEHTADYNKPEEVRVSHILVDSKAKAKEVLAKYKEQASKDKVAAARHFRTLVNEYSTDDKMNKQRGGDLAFFAKDSTKFPKELVTAAFTLEKTGDVSEPVKTARGWHVLRLTGRRKAISRAFDQVKRQIQNRLYREKRQEAQKTFVEELKKKANVQVFADRLDKVKINTTPSAGGSLAGRLRRGHGPMRPGEKAPVPPRQPPFKPSIKGMKRSMHLSGKAPIPRKMAPPPGVKGPRAAKPAPPAPPTKAE